MKTIRLMAVMAAMIFLSPTAEAEIEKDWKAQWISLEHSLGEPGTWAAFRKTVNVGKVPEKAIAKIAVDSRYWLWINGELVVREGGLKRGPNRNDTYFDEIDIAPYLTGGDNLIAVLVWHFGRHGFSHNDSGQLGLLFDCRAEGLSILSDDSWQGDMLNAFGRTEGPEANYRIPEINICFDARKDIGEWYKDPTIVLGQTMALAEAGESPWNQLHRRPIPQWKDWGTRKYEEVRLLSGEIEDTLECRLPYDAQVHPAFSFRNAAEGSRIRIISDNYLHLLFETGIGGIPVHAEYITKKGAQKFECYDWMCGHKIYYLLPHGQEIPDVWYRETGYDADFAANFESSSDFWNRYWQKSARSLYVNMRDTYYDCPDRERSQWTGDAVNSNEQAFYSLSRSADSLGAKWLREICAWQKSNGQIYAPVPSGNYTRELSGQCLSSVGYFGLWTYYMHTGDRSVLEDTYDAVKKYLSLWKMKDDGTPEYRTGEWAWGDWGDNKDMEGIYSILYYHAVSGHRNAAEVLGKTSDVARMDRWMERFRKGFNESLWNGKSYRTPTYSGFTDDRVQALAAVAGVAEIDKYPMILQTLKEEQHASPYMERYVMQALFEMSEKARDAGAKNYDIYARYALQRGEERFKNMVLDQRYSTLFEGWETGGSVNHAWSGGANISLGRYVCGLRPLAPGYSKFEVSPIPAGIDRLSYSIPSKAGMIRISYSLSGRGNGTSDKGRTMTLTVTVPQGAECTMRAGNHVETHGCGTWTIKGKL